MNQLIKRLGSIRKLAPEFHRRNKKDITKVVYSIIKKYGENKNDEIFIQSFPKTLKD